MIRKDKHATKKQIKSKKRVVEHGEVFTNQKDIRNMLDMIPLWDNANQALNSTFLEPACGDGNFLAEIVSRKLELISKSKKPNYKKDQSAYEKAILLVAGSIYGIDIMSDNTSECVARIYKLITDKYEKTFKETFSDDVEHCIRFILSRNIVCGNALDMKDYKGELIKFSEWKNPSNGWINRKEYIFKDLIKQGDKALPFSDTRVPYYISKEIKDYGNIDYWRVYEYANQE